MSKIKIRNHKFNSKILRKILNYFPPLLVNRIKIVENDSDFMNLKVVIKYSWLNKNLQKSIFGGTIFSAIDPYYAIMYWQIFNKKNIPMEIWIKKVDINYCKAATSNLEIFFRLTNFDIKNALYNLSKKNKFEVWHNVSVVDINHEICAEANVLVHIKNSQNHNLSSYRTKF